jgi:hypothetical protein
MTVQPFRTLPLALSVLLLAGRAIAQDNMVIYGDVLENGWHDDSWDITEGTSSTIVHSGTAAVSATMQGDGTYYLGHYSFNPQLYQSLTFWLNGGAAGGQNLILYATVNGNAGAGYTIPPLKSGTWQQISVPLSTLGVAGNPAFDGLIIKNNSSSSAPVFYIDDISLTGVTPPATVQIAVNASNVLRTVDSRLYGANIAIWDSALSSAATGTLLAAMNTQIVRFPGGAAADNYDWQTDMDDVNPGGYQWASNAATFAQVAAAENAQAFVTVNYGSGTPQQAAAWVAYYNAATTGTAILGTDAKGRNWQTAGYWASIRAAAPLAHDDGYNFLRISHPAPFGFTYWELGNECYGTWETDLHGVSGSGLAGAQWDAVTYANAFATFSQQMLAVDPTIHIGAVSVPGEDSYPGTHTVTNPVTNATHKGWTPVLLWTLHSLGIAPSFLIDHRYPQDPSSDGNPSDGDECDATLLESSTDGATDATNLRGQITDYLGATAGAGVELTITELNSVTYNPGKQSVSLVNGLFLADSIGLLTQTEVNACVWWDFRNGTMTGDNNGPWLYGWRQFGDYGLVASGDQAGTPLNTPYASYYAAALLTHWARGGDQAVATTSSYAALSAYGARLASGNLALLVINKSPSTNFTAQINSSGFSPGSATGAFWQYGETNDSSSSGLTRGTFGNASSSFSYPFPPYSMTVLQLPAPAPVITALLGTQQVAAGQPATLSISATGDGPFSYQWYKNGAAIAGASNSSYTIPDTSSINSGSYTVTVTDANGTTTTSAPYTLTVTNGIPAMNPWALAALPMLLLSVALSFLRGKQCRV